MMVKARSDLSVYLFSSHSHLRIHAKLTLYPMSYSFVFLGVVGRKAHFITKTNTKTRWMSVLVAFVDHANCDASETLTCSPDWKLSNVPWAFIILFVLKVILSPPFSHHRRYFEGILKEVKQQAQHLAEERQKFDRDWTKTTKTWKKLRTCSPPFRLFLSKSLHPTPLSPLPPTHPMPRPVCSCGKASHVKEQSGVSLFARCQNWLSLLLVLIPASTAAAVVRSQRLPSQRELLN